MSEESRKATLNQVIQDQVENRLKSLHTCIPGIIDSFDPFTGRASIQPAVQRVKTDGEVESLPLLINCPIGNLKAGGFVITMPVKPGDECMIHFTERSIDAWIKFGDIRRPNDLRLHDISDCYFIPMTSSEPNSTQNYDADNMVLRNENNDLKITFDTSGNMTIDAVSTVEVNVPTMNINANVNIDGNLDVTGNTDIGGNLDVTGDATASEVTAGTTVLTTHVHTGVASGSSNSGPPL